MQRHRSQEAALASGFQRPQGKQSPIRARGALGRTIAGPGRGEPGRAARSDVPVPSQPRASSGCGPPRPDVKAGSGPPARGSPSRSPPRGPALSAPVRAARPGLQDGAGAAQLRRLAAGGGAGMNAALFAGSRGCPRRAGPAQRRLYARGMEMSPAPRSSPAAAPSSAEECGQARAGKEPWPGTLPSRLATPLARARCR
ncbi:hypothetical protein VULLAG_LOCUS8945 [Vulpes lagopus]